MEADINPIGGALTVLGALLILFLPRRYALIPLLAAACYITVGQVIYVGSLDFTTHRILLLVGWVRLILRGECNLSRLNLLDGVMIAWVVAITITHTMLVGTFNAFINRLGFAYNALGFYFLFRVLVIDLADIRRLVRVIALLLLPLAVLMQYEALTLKNFFASFGGVPELAVIRDGDVRAQGPFRHPILAGTFAATSFALIVSLWWHRRTPRLLTLSSLAAAVGITLATSSSGPFMALAFVCLAGALWPLRHQVRALAWAGLGVGVIVQLYMNSPLWFLLDRIGDVLGGEGYHRSLLIDRAVEHIDEWWLLGTTYTAHWMPHTLPLNPNMVDITNFYLRMGVDGGVVTMVLFITVLIVAFGSVGRCVAAFEEVGMPFADVFAIWALGAALLGHASAFMSVSYFDQIVVFWYLLLALIGTARDMALAIEQHAPPRRTIETPSPQGQVL